MTDKITGKTAGKAAERTGGKTADKNEKQDIEQLLRDGYAVQLKPQGYSMYPLIIPGRDMAVIEWTDAKQAKRGDVLLYRRDGSILVLHRVYRHRAGKLYMVGDNQTEIEGPLREDQVRGKLTALIRRGHRIPVTNPVYRTFTWIWLMLRPLRPAISRTAHCIRVFLKR